MKQQKKILKPYRMGSIIEIPEDRINKLKDRQQNSPNLHDRDIMD